MESLKQVAEHASVSFDFCVFLAAVDEPEASSSMDFTQSTLFGVKTISNLWYLVRFLVL